MDNQIIALILKKDNHGLDLLEEYYGDFIRYILRCLRLSGEDIEECYNDVLMKLWESVTTYQKDQSSFKNYIGIITRRIGLNYVRKNKKLLKEIQYEQMDIFGTKEIANQIDWTYILSCISLKEKDLFYRHYFYFQTIEEIALEKGKTYKSIES